MDFGDDGRGFHAVEPGARLGDDQREPGGVQRSLLAAGERHMQDGFIRRSLGGRLPGTLPASLLAIEDIGARDLVVLAAHQGQFDLVLNVLDMEGASLAHPPCQRAHHIGGQLFHDSRVPGGRRRRHGPRPQGTPWSSRPKSCRRRTWKPRRCGGSPALEARLPAAASDSGRSWITGVALASRSSESDIGRPRGCCAGAGYLWGRCMNARRKRRHETASDRRDTPPVDVLVSRQVSWLAGRHRPLCLPNARPHQ